MVWESKPSMWWPNLPLFKRKRQNCTCCHGWASDYGRKANSKRCFKTLELGVAGLVQRMSWFLQRNQVLLPASTLDCLQLPIIQLQEVKHSWPLPRPPWTPTFTGTYLHTEWMDDEWMNEPCLSVMCGFGGFFFSEPNNKKLTAMIPGRRRLREISELFYFVPFSILGNFSIVFILLFIRRSTGIKAPQFLIHTFLYWKQITVQM